jgi:hypothetical protein
MHAHHTSTTPGAIIGYRRNGTPIRLIAGGPGGGASAADDSASRTIAAVREDFKQEPARRQALQKDLDDLKTAQARQAEETQQRNLALAKALGLTTDEPPDRHSWQRIWLRPASRPTPR